MRAVLRTVAVCLLLALVLVLCAAPEAGAAGTQTWLLDDDNTMSTTTSPSGSVSISGGGNYMWRTDVAAETDVTFPSDGDWMLLLSTDSNWKAKCTAQVGSWDGTNFTPFDQTQAISSYVSGGTIMLVIKTQSLNDEATVSTGDWLAVKVSNSDTVSHAVYADGLSSLASPETDPGYPVPELSTALLTGIGLMGLGGVGGVVMLRRRRASFLRCPIGERSARF